MPRRIARVIAILVGLIYLILGVWAFGLPESFAAVIAPFPPYNEHYLHDLGAFQIGIGVGVIAGAVTARTDGLRVGLLGAAAASAAHTASHVLDRDLGGHALDPYSVGSLALLVIAGWAFVRRDPGPSTTAGHGRTHDPSR